MCSCVYHVFLCVQGLVRFWCLYHVFLCLPCVLGVQGLVRLWWLGPWPMSAVVVTQRWRSSWGKVLTVWASGLASLRDNCVCSLTRYKTLVALPCVLNTEHWTHTGWLTRLYDETFTELKFGLSAELSHKLKWFHWALTSVWLQSFRSAKRFSKSISPKVWSNYILRPKFSWTLV